MTEKTTEFCHSVENRHVWNIPSMFEIGLRIKHFDFYVESIAFKIKILINITLF